MTVPAIARNDWPRVSVPDLGCWTPKHSVSVVVPAKGSQAHLDRCLVALGEQTYPAGLLDIVVVDDASEIPLKVSDPRVRLERHAPHGTFGAGRARNTGANACIGEILVFLDADVLVAPTFVEEHARWHHAVPYAVVSGVLGFADFDQLDAAGLIQVLRKEGLDAAVGDAGHDSQEWRDRHFLRSHDLTVEAPDLFRSTIGAVTSLQRSMFERIGGYREVGVRGVEDTEFGYRLHAHGGLFILERTTRLWHQGRRSFDSGKRNQINEVRKPHVEDLIPVNGMRPVPAQRRYKVPTLGVRIVCGCEDQPAQKRLLTTLRSLAACPDLDMVVMLNDEQVLVPGMDEILASGNEPVSGPVICGDDGLEQIDREAIPFWIEMHAGVEILPTGPAQIVETMRAGVLGALHLLSDPAPGTSSREIATVRWTRATARAVLSGASGNRERVRQAGSLFSERWLPAAELSIQSHDVGVNATEATVEVDRSAEPTEGVAATQLDMLYLTDLRFPGGTSSSLIDEVSVARQHGYRIGVLHLANPLLGHGNVVKPQVQALIDQGSLIHILPGEAVRTRVVLVKHPMVFHRPTGAPLPIETDQVVVIAGQVPRHEDGHEYCVPAEVNANVVAALGVHPVWMPISPVVRRELNEVDLSADDWVEITEVPVDAPTRAVAPGSVPVIGRHGRPSMLKWPATAAEVLEVYPDDEAARVKVLGAPEALEEMLGGYPPNWEVLEFGSTPVREFLDSIDYFVYFHHPDLIEAFGRTILEALAAGVVAIVPPHFEEMFGEACLYARPSQVTELLRGLQDAPDEYHRQSVRGHRLVAERFSLNVHLERLLSLIGPPGPLAHRRGATRPETITVRQYGDRPTVLVSCIGLDRSGVDDALRSLDEHRRHQLGFVPLVVTSGIRSELADQLGIETKVITGRQKWSDPQESWTEFAIRRLRQIASSYRVDSIVPAQVTHPDAWIALASWSRPRELVNGVGEDNEI
jgi:glycosyltransferase involved in cell wall biosynthesis